MIGLLVLLAGKSSRAAKVLTIALWLTVALSATVIVLAVSRNGIISMLVAGTVMIVAFTLHRVIQPRHALLLLVAAAVVMIAFFLGFDAVSRRLSSLSHPENPYSKRWIILLSLTDSWRQFPLWGTGLGTFQYIFPMVDRQIRVESYLSHAENEYAQMLTETGILGLLCVGLFLFEIVRSYIRCIRRSRSAMTSVAIALGFGILAIVIHSFTDFSQHVPGIACLTAIYAGWIFRISRDPRGSTVSSAVSPRRSIRWKIAWLLPPATPRPALSRRM
jgi:O-antigen ligase